MALQLSMVGLAVTDMDRSLAFYRRLGLAVPQESEGQPHIEVKMQGEFTLFFDTRTIPREHPAGGEAQEKPRGAIFEYYLKTQAAVEAKYAELLGYGYQSYHAPFIFSNGMCFALVEDPDGNPSCSQATWSARVNDQASGPNSRSRPQGKERYRDDNDCTEF